MTVFKCKMCGGTLEFEPGATVGVCDHCGSKQTLPRLDDERRANLYDRANHFRRGSDFDKAAALYEQILTEDPDDAEAYWSLVLCRFGIEYVEDPKTRRRVPTVNRTQYTSVFDDDNYRSALRCADAAQRALYEAEAAAINEIQKGILEISSKEEPFDVFICYKEADEAGRRTPDSVLANDLYHQLTLEGFKVFYARITLEDKLGQEYEPYIFAALNTAKVMVVLGTKPEYFRAVWVRNEWSRYLTLVKTGGGKKTLIPAYRDMDPYDLPDEFSHLQALDMSRLGFMQDLIRGIKKIARADEPAQAPAKETVVMDAGAAPVAPLLKRAFMFLEDGEFASADEYCEKVLDRDPENARAYLGKLMAELRVRRQEDLAGLAEPFDANRQYAKALRFGDEALAAELKGYNERIRKHNEMYSAAVLAMRAADSEAAYLEAAEMFRSIKGWKDADTQEKECREAASRRSTREQEAERQKRTREQLEAYKAVCAKVRVDAETALKDRIAEADEGFEARRQAIESELNAALADSDRQRRAAETRIAELKRTQAALGLFRAKEKRALQEEIDGQETLRKKIPSGEEIRKRYQTQLDTVSSEQQAERDRIHKEIKAAYPLPRIPEECITVGEVLPFGSYQQDEGKQNSKTEIEWLVLARKADRILLISRYTLDCKQYNGKSTNVTWETCSLRKWLNGEFLNTAFTAEEQAMIPTVTVSADRNPKYKKTSPGNSTQDKVFLLSIDEANQYFSGDEARKCVPTAYAIAQGAYTDSDYTLDGKPTCWWWLRSPGRSSDLAAYVDYDGSVDAYGYYVDYVYAAVRPALWINLES